MRDLKAKMRAERRVKFLQDQEELERANQEKKVSGRQELDELLEMNKMQKEWIRKFKLRHLSNSGTNSPASAT